MFIFHNENPRGRRTTDCTIRAISTALGQDWDATHAGVWVKSAQFKDMMEKNYVWGAYLRERGWVRRIVPDSCPDCYTVADFAAEHPRGTYILAIDGHVVCVVNGDWLDTFDSGDMVPLYYWTKG